jgi:DNA-binding MarR family transcriptional regulator
MTPDASDNPSADAALVDALSTRLESFEHHAARQVVSWIEDAGLSVAELQVFLALADGKPRGGAELAEAAGLPVDLSYPAMHRLGARGWLVDDGRRHRLSEAGQEKVDELAATRRAAVADFVASLSAQERRDLAVAFGAQR